MTPATAVIVVTGYSVTYDALPHTATGTATGVFGEDLSADLDLSATTHTAVGSYDRPVDASAIRQATTPTTPARSQRDHPAPR